MEPNFKLFLRIEQESKKANKKCLKNLTLFIQIII